ncbi:hypothetical protein IAD21_00745 [Abditibacteriota bacterium]|nr:hypothetical protein IAD21_00745 [Abditibacteriota bacterium]
MKRLANPSPNQLIAVGILLFSAGSLVGPPIPVSAQPQDNAPGNGDTQATGVPEPLATPLTPSGETFTARAPRAVGTITGQGTTGTIAKFTGTNAIGNSVMIESGGKIGIGTTTPAGLLSVKGTAANVYPIYGLGVGNAILGSSSGGIGIYGQHTNTSGVQAGVVGESSSTTANAIGVTGLIKSTAPGSSSAGVRGINNGTGYEGYGVYGSHAGFGPGVYGTSVNGVGVQGRANKNSGVEGFSTTSDGVYGSSSSGVGVYGDSDSSVGTYGTSSSGIGVYGTSSDRTGVYGQSYNSTGVYGDSVNGNAGFFHGNVIVTGTLVKGAGSFKIDHPQHPATEYLSHSFVESPDMMNVYNGNATTNGKGEVWVRMPSYFQSLNRDFRYQLTPIGQFAQVIVGQKMSGNRFLIRTDKPGVEVSWQVTGIRNDAYARAHRIRVEETKARADRGKYLYPAGFGFGADKQIGQSAPRLAKR